LVSKEVPRSGGGCIVRLFRGFENVRILSCIHFRNWHTGGCAIYPLSNAATTTDRFLSLLLMVPAIVECTAVLVKDGFGRHAWT
jgi:hypothetical protein